jgi:hypothetical protein
LHVVRYQNALLHKRLQLYPLRMQHTVSTLTKGINEAQSSPVKIGGARATCAEHRCPMLMPVP